MDVEKHKFHIYLISDSTGETLEAVSRAALAQYSNIKVVEHPFTLVRGLTRLHNIINDDVRHKPGIVLYTLVDSDLANELEQLCRKANIPFFSVLAPVYNVFRQYLGNPPSLKAGAQHVLNESYFSNIEALNYTMLHDDGMLNDDLSEADIVIIGVSRTSKTPTSIYLANRGFKVANIPIIIDIPLPDVIFRLKNKLIVGLIATPKRIAVIRHQRALGGGLASVEDNYIDEYQIEREILLTKQLCHKNGWPLIDVTRRSVEETAVTIINLLNK